jgi:hypothetical protein
MQDGAVSHDMSWKMEYVDDMKFYLMQNEETSHDDTTKM